MAGGFRSLFRCLRPSLNFDSSSPSSYAASGFPALRTPARFSPRAMGPIKPSALSAATAPDDTRGSAQTGPTCRTATNYSSRTPCVSVTAARPPSASSGPAHNSPAICPRERALGATRSPRIRWHPLSQVHYSTLQLVQNHMEPSLLLARASCYRPNQPAMTQVDINQDRDIIGKTHVLNLRALVVSRRHLGTLQHPVHAHLKGEFGGRHVRVRGHAKVLCRLKIGILPLAVV